MRERSLTHSTTTETKTSEQIIKFSSHTYIILFKKEIVLSYILNTGYIGIY